ncbi:MAG: hypothetical protein WD470_08560 [Rhodospirillaceae bacterium]
MAGKRGSGEIILEFQQIGNAVKVTAVDSATLVEVSIVGPASAGQKVLKRNAINKLRYVLFKRNNAG